jgi:hypothetical protein
VKLATKQKSFDLYQPVMGLGGVAEMFHKSCRIVADVTKHGIYSVSVLSV